MTAAVALPAAPIVVPSTPKASATIAGEEFTAAVAAVRQCGWALLAFWAVVSVFVNGVHADLAQPEGSPVKPLAAAMFGVLAPLALLGVTELIARLLRLAHLTHGSRLVYGAVGLALVGATGLALAAFRLSFAGLSEFGVMCGVPTDLARLVPCIIDGAILVADVAVIAASTAARLVPAADSVPEPSSTPPAAALVTSTAAPAAVVVPAPLPVAAAVPSPTPSAPVQSTPASAVARKPPTAQRGAATARSKAAPAIKPMPPQKLTVHEPASRPRPATERPRMTMVMPRLDPV